MELLILSKCSVLCLLLIYGGKGVYSEGKEGDHESRPSRPSEGNQQNGQNLNNFGNQHSPDCSGCPDCRLDKGESGTYHKSNGGSQTNRSGSPKTTKPTENDSEADRSKLILFTASGIISTVFILTLVALSFVYLKKRNKINNLITNTELTPEEIV